MILPTMKTDTLITCPFHPSTLSPSAQFAEAPSSSRDHARGSGTKAALPAAV